MQMRGRLKSMLSHSVSGKNASADAAAAAVAANPLGDAAAAVEPSGGEAAQRSAWAVATSAAAGPSSWLQPPPPQPQPPLLPLSPAMQTQQQQPLSLALQTPPSLAAAPIVRVTTGAQTGVGCVGAGRLLSPSSGDNAACGGGGGRLRSAFGIAGTPPAAATGAAEAPQQAPAAVTFASTASGHQGSGLASQPNLASLPPHVMCEFSRAESAASASSSIPLLGELLDTIGRLCCWRS